MKKLSVKFFMLVGIIVPVGLISSCGNKRAKVREREYGHVPSRRLESKVVEEAGQSQVVIPLPGHLRKLDIDNPNGSVTLKRGGTRNELRVEFRSRRMSVEGIKIEPQIHGSEVRIVAPERPGLATHLTVYLSNSPDVDINQNNGHISVSGLNACCRINNINGSIHLTDLLGDIRAKTMNGSIHFEARDPFDRTCDLSSQNGSIQISIPQTSSVRLDLTSRRGRAQSHLKMHDVREEVIGWREGNSLSGVVGSGKGRIHATVVNGGIEVF